MFDISLSKTTQLFKPWVSPSFVEQHAPRLFLPPPQSVELPRPRSLLDEYLGGHLRHLVGDAEDRPEHYTDAQRAQLEQLHQGHRLRPQEESELLLQFMRRSDAQKAERTTRKERTKKEVAPEEGPPPFEDQDLFQGAIKLV